MQSSAPSPSRQGVIFHFSLHILCFQWAGKWSPVDSVSRIKLENAETISISYRRWPFLSGWPPCWPYLWVKVAGAGWFALLRSGTTTALPLPPAPCPQALWPWAEFPSSWMWPAPLGFNWGLHRALCSTRLSALKFQGLPTSKSPGSSQQTFTCLSSTPHLLNIRGRAQESRGGDSS